jgi:hypothetical protein
MITGDKKSYLKAVDKFYSNEDKEERRYKKEEDKQLKKEKKEYGRIVKTLTSGGGARKSYSSGFATQKIRKVL